MSVYNGMLVTHSVITTKIWRDHGFHISDLATNPGSRSSDPHGTARVVFRSIRLVGPIVRKPQADGFDSVGRNTDIPHCWVLISMGLLAVPRWRGVATQYRRRPPPESSRSWIAWQRVGLGAKRRCIGRDQLCSLGSRLGTLNSTAAVGCARPLPILVSHSTLHSSGSRRRGWGR